MTTKHDRLPVDADMIANKPKPSRFRWTTGRMPGVLHEDLIAIGGGGEVHKVPRTIMESLTKYR